MKTEDNFWLKTNNFSYCKCTCPITANVIAHTIGENYSRMTYTLSSYTTLLMLKLGQLIISQIQEFCYRQLQAKHWSREVVIDCKQSIFCSKICGEEHEKLSKRLVPRISCLFGFLHSTSWISSKRETARSLERYFNRICSTYCKLDLWPNNINCVDIYIF